MAGDPYWYYKVLGLHCDGTNGSTTFTDVKGKTVTANGNAQISTAQYPALTGKTASAYFDGSGDYLTVPDSADWSFGSGDFTLRMRCYFTGYSASYSGNYALGLISQESAGGGSFFFYVNGTVSSLTGLGFSGFYDPGATFFVLSLGTYTFSLNTWYDIEFCRSGNTAYAFVDGQMTNSGGTSFSQVLRDSTAELTIGRSGYNGDFPFIGYMSEIEIYKGVALHTANFTPPSIPFPDEYVYLSGTTRDSSGAFASRIVRAYHRGSGNYIGEVVSNASTGAWKITATKAGEYFAIAHPSVKTITDNKKLVIPFSGSNNSTIFTDLCGAGVTPIMGGKIVTTQTDPFGGSTGVFYAASTSDGAKFNRALDTIGATGDFHVRCWVYPLTFPDGATLFLTLTNGVQWQRNGSMLGVAKVGVTWYFYASSNPPTNTWTYVQLRRSGTTLAIYYGSTLVGSATVSATFDASTAGSMFTGWTGYACDFEFLQYADSVTPPTSRVTGFSTTTENALIYDNITPA